MWTMAFEDILRLKSNDAVCYQEEHDFCLPGVTVADELTIEDIDDEYHQRIKKVMAREGINRVPVLIINDVLYNGHRRLKIAQELGLEEINCTDDWDESGWWNEEEVIGEEECESQLT